jgi:hypothetical protein
MEALQSIPTICGEDTISVGQQVWVEGLASMATRFGGTVNSMKAEVLAIGTGDHQGEVLVEQKGTTALPVFGEAWVHWFPARQITV